MVVICIIAGLAVLCLLICYCCYRMAFYSKPRKNGMAKAVPLPDGEVYKAFQPIMDKWARELEEIPYKEFEIVSFDGLKLYGKYYEYAPGAPIEIMFHGYRGSAERDLAGGVNRCFGVGRSALLVDQRGGGRSEGHVISFGINEHRDCLKWVDFVVEHFGPGVKIILTGISMGAATVLIAGGKELPPNVIGILADCGYSSAKAIMEKVIVKMGLPPKLLYPFVKLSAKIFGGFDLEETSPVEAVKHCKVPVIFYHGEADDYVPCSMSVENYNNCASRKQLVTIPGAGHGLSYPVDQEKYLITLKEFFGPEASAKR